MDGEPFTQFRRHSRLTIARCMSGLMDAFACESVSRKSYKLTQCIGCFEIDLDDHARKSQRNHPQPAIRQEAIILNQSQKSRECLLLWMTEEVVSRCYTHVYDKASHRWSSVSKWLPKSTRWWRCRARVGVLFIRWGIEEFLFMLQIQITILDWDLAYSSISCRCVIFIVGSPTRILLRAAEPRKIGRYSHTRWRQMQLIQTKMRYTTTATSKPKSTYLKVWRFSRSAGGQAERVTATSR